MLSIATAIISAIAGAFKVLSEWMRQQKDALLIALGGQKQKVDDLEGRLRALNKANKAREDARADVERASGGLLDDDGFRRKDDGDN